MLDSAKIVLQVKLNELKKVETNIQLRGYPKYDLYKRFLNASLPDTISRAEAGTVQQFMNAGEVMKQYNDTKAALIGETEKSISQLQKLSHDLQNEAIAVNQAQLFFDTEKARADKLVQVIEKNVAVANIALMNFRNSMAGTEALIRKINNNRLPEVVADSTAN